ncbi:MAG: shikimate kinase [Bacillota bacterium]|jgi:shikimate kinase
MTETNVKKNIVLIGFMGSGKTVIGRAVSRLTDYEFVDTDGEIEKVTGLTINQIFKKYGQRRFRSEEELVLKKLLNRESLVIAAGGNIDLESDNLELLKESGFFVLLEANPEVLYQRLCRKNTRPLIGKRPTMDRINELLNERREHYEELADFRLDTSEVSVEEAAEMIVKNFEHLNNSSLSL